MHSYFSYADSIQELQRLFGATEVYESVVSDVLVLDGHGGVYVEDFSHFSLKIIEVHMRYVD